MALDMQGTDFLKLPSGTTAQRPAIPVAGMVRYNTDLGAMEKYTTSWNNLDCSLADANAVATAMAIALG